MIFLRYILAKKQNYKPGTNLAISRVETNSKSAKVHAQGSGTRDLGFTSSKTKNQLTHGEQTPDSSR